MMIDQVFAIGAAGLRRGSPLRAGQRLKVAYLMSRFPKLTETFILYEMLAVEQQGVQIELYPLLRERTTVMHPEAAEMVARAHFQPFISWPILLAHWYFLRHRPRLYLSTLWALLRGTWGSLRFFIGALGLFPKTVYFARRMAAEGIGHVHAHFASHPAAAAFVIHRLTGIPYSFTAHGSDLHRDRRMLREKVAEARFVVTISNYNKALILAECGEHFSHDVHLIRCGVDTQVFHLRSPKAPQRRASHPFTLLCIGTLHDVKGQTYLIEAARLLQEQGIDFACHLVGDGPDRAKLARQIAQAGLGHRVHLLGQRTRQEIADMLGQADVVVAPSVPTRSGRREGIPVVLIEALGSGVPVVASRLSGIPELVEHEWNGLLVPIRDAQALADALLRLQRDPGLRQRLGEHGQEKVEREFNLKTNAATLTQYFLGEGLA
jgi:glycosyltransferase involved in cell wall biosynthesis